MRQPEILKWILNLCKSHKIYIGFIILYSNLTISFVRVWEQTYTLENPNELSFLIPGFIAYGLTARRPLAELVFKLSLCLCDAACTKQNEFLCLCPYSYHGRLPWTLILYRRFCLSLDKASFCLCKYDIWRQVDCIGLYLESGQQSSATTLIFHFQFVNGCPVWCFWLKSEQKFLRA